MPFEFLCYTGSPNDAVAGYPIPLIQGSCIIDGHMHINSGACAPLPLLYVKKWIGLGQTPLLKRRDVLETVLKTIGFGNGVDTQRLTTVQIGEKIAEINKRVYRGLINSFDFCDLDLTQEHLENKDLQVISPMIVAPMDMEYAHIAGYGGITIYHGEKEELFFYRRSSGKYIAQCEKYDDKRVSLAHEYDKQKGLKLHKWQIQCEQTINAAAKYPLQLFPLYFYDPRRWRFPSGKTMPESMEFGAWDEPFKSVASAQRPGVFIGFKMYPPLGHKPFDELCEYLPDFYDRCETEHIPILTHCSPGGLFTHEASWYSEFDSYNEGMRFKGRVNQSRRLSALLFPKGRHVPPVKPVTETYVGFDKMIEKYREYLSDQEFNSRMDYFFKNYVHPEEWRKVLKYFPDLRLCLAHFGGDEWRRGRIEEWQTDGVQSEWIKSIIDLTKEYANVYTDISCFNLDDTLEHGDGTVQDSLRVVLEQLDDKRYYHLRHKIIFGTDWYLTMLNVTKGGDYGNYCQKAKRFLDSIDRTLWIRFTLVNPWEFYGFGDKRKLNNIRKGLENEAAKEDRLKHYYNKFLSIGNEISELKEYLQNFEKFNYQLKS
ncbi:MAG: amidohydrolase family protein [Fibrobacter sp.]|nr:amidohydrolase family protein [Fibrobacter sp.]